MIYIIIYIYIFDVKFIVLHLKIQSESENCYKVIKSSWQQIEDTAKQPGGLHMLRKSFRICK
jgi:hypothetical protein